MSHLNSALKGESVDGAKLEQLLLGKPADDLRGLQGQARPGGGHDGSCQGGGREAAGQKDDGNCHGHPCLC